jgi:short subunit dehydrogenase-like uncharacterized protein
MQNQPFITVFGATGYTGRQVAQVLDREGLPYRLAGRSPEKLAELSARLLARPPWLVADAARNGSLPPLFQDSRVLINCAGPFTDLGERVVAQAAMSGSHYLDTTNELGFVFRARGYRQMAARTGSALVPSCAFEVALADCAAALVGQKLLAANPTEPLERVDVVYVLDGQRASVGTRRSAIRSLATSWIGYRDGTWTGQMPGSRVRRFDLPGGPRQAVLIPSSETVTLPLHLPLRQVEVWAAAPAAARFLAPVIVPLFARLSRSILRPLVLRLASAGGLKPGEAPGGGLQAGPPFTVLVAAGQGQRARWMALAGRDPYGLTAEIAVYAARRLASAFTKSGLLAPSQALDPQTFLDHAARHWDLAIQEGSENPARG